MPLKEGKTRVTVTVANELKEKAQKIIDDTGITMSALLNLALTDYLDQRENIENMRKGQLVDMFIKLQSNIEKE